MPKYDVVVVGAGLAGLSAHIVQSHRFSSFCVNTSQ